VISARESPAADEAIATAVAEASFIDNPGLRSGFLA